MARSNFFIIYNGQMNKEFNVSVRYRPDMPTPAREYETIKVEGRDGELYEDKGTYEDITISIDFNFSAQPDEWQERFRRIKKWLYRENDRRLIMSDDREYFYNVKRVQIETTERVIKRIGRFTVKFTCEPYAYLAAGNIVMQLEDVLVNQFETACPTYYIYGTGEIELTVNGNTVTAVVDGSLTINTKLGLCYNSGQNIENTALSGDYDDLILQEGTNTFAYTKGFEVRIRPNWRSI